MTVEQDASRAPRNEPHNGAHRRCLADPVATEQGEDRAGRDLNVHGYRSAGANAIYGKAGLEGFIRSGPTGRT